MAQTESAPDQERLVPDKSVAWYIKDEDVPQLSPAGQDLLVRYSHVKPDEVRSHVLELV